MVVLLAPRSEIRGGKQSESAIMCRPCLKNEPAQIAKADACSPLSLSHDLRTGNFHARNYQQHPSSAHSRSTLRSQCHDEMSPRHDLLASIAASYTLEILVRGETRALRPSRTAELVRSDSWAGQASHDRRGVSLPNATAPKALAA